MNFLLSFNAAKDFNYFAEIEDKNNRVRLLFGGNKFYCDRDRNGYQYWRCSLVSKYNCKARMVTRLINGYNMLKVTNAKHCHRLQDLRKKKKTQNDLQ